jgi:hypothetical protein
MACQVRYDPIADQIPHRNEATISAKTGSDRVSEALCRDVMQNEMKSRDQMRLRRTVRAKRARAAGMSPAALALRSDAARGVAWWNVAMRRGAPRYLR